MTAPTRPVVLRRPHLALLLAALHAPKGILTSAHFSMDTADLLLGKGFISTEDTVYRQQHGLRARISNTLLRVELTDAGRLRLEVELAYLEDSDPESYLELVRYYPIGVPAC